MDRRDAITLHGGPLDGKSYQLHPDALGDSLYFPLDVPLKNYWFGEDVPIVMPVFVQIRYQRFMFPNPLSGLTHERWEYVASGSAAECEAVTAWERRQEETEYTQSIAERQWVAEKMRQAAGFETPKTWMDCCMGSYDRFVPERIEREAQAGVGADDLSWMHDLVGSWMPSEADMQRQHGEFVLGMMDDVIAHKMSDPTPIPVVTDTTEDWAQGWYELRDHILRSAGVPADSLDRLAWEEAQRRRDAGLPPKMSWLNEITGCMGPTVPKFATYAELEAFTGKESPSAKDWTGLSMNDVRALYELPPRTDVDGDAVDAFGDPLSDEPILR